MVLLEIIKQWQRTLNINLAVAYVHHGRGPVAKGKTDALKKNVVQINYRDAARETVGRYCEENGIRFLTNARPPRGLKSENDFRTYRWMQLAGFADQILTETQPFVTEAQPFLTESHSQTADKRGYNQQRRNVLIATAHHADDLIETQLLRLLRGTGPQGLRGFSERDALESESRDRDALESATRTGEGKARSAANIESAANTGAPATAQATKAQTQQPPKFIIRPLLTHTKAQIEAYAKAKKLKFTQDPSNTTTDALRNWLRTRWLKPLSRRDKQKATNHLKSLAGSLAALGNAGVKQEWPKNLFQKATLHTPTFRTLSKSQQEAALATFMHAQQMKNYTKNHVAEILKRLDTREKELKFRLLGREWKITAQHISYGRLDVPSE